MNHGRDKLKWNQEIWNRIDQAVHDEAKRTKVAARFLPLYMASPDTLVVLSDTTEVDTQNRLTVNQGATTPIVEILVEFALTPEQYQKEPGLMTAVTLVTRAMNLLSQAEDVVIFQGKDATDAASPNQHSLFKDKKVSIQYGPPGEGLLLATSLPAGHLIKVPSIKAGEEKWGEKTFEKVAEGYALLQNKGHYGPYALVLPTKPYADTYAPLEKTLIMPADRIKPLVTTGDTVHFYGTGTLPKLTGLLVSIGGNTVDLAVGIDATTAFMQEDPKGPYLFRIYERFVLRLKDKSAVIKFEFTV